jgi:hypothetical protein
MTTSIEFLRMDVNVLHDSLALGQLIAHVDVEFSRGTPCLALICFKPGWNHCVTITPKVSWCHIGILIECVQMSVLLGNIRSAQVLKFGLC